MSGYRARLIDSLEPGEWVELAYRQRPSASHSDQLVERGFLVWQPIDERTVLCVGKPEVAACPV